jgi:branched-chain amino acid transport system permease protein
MQFIFKTKYDQDIHLIQHRGQLWSYGLLLALMLLAPLLLSSYLQSQFVFVFIYAIVGISLMILTGFTGQGSLGHAAFLAIGAYTTAFLQSKGVPFAGMGLFALDLNLPWIGASKLWLPHLGYFLWAGVLTGVIGALVGFPALRLHGIYLLIATISFAFIVEEILARWESVTHGNEGLRVRTLQAWGVEVPTNHASFYYLCLAVLVLVIIGALNLMRSPTGRAFIAIRDSETAAKSMGIDIAAYKVKSFAISAAITGLAGSLYAHKLSFISPEMFTLLLSIEFVMVIIIGGAIGLHGAVLGAIFIVMVDPLLTWVKDDVPSFVAGFASTLGAGPARAQSIEQTLGNVASAAGLKGAIYGIIIMLFILFEPMGLYGRWLKIKLFFQLFPLYKRATFKRQKIYVKSERNR